MLPNHPLALGLETGPGTSWVRGRGEYMVHMVETENCLGTVGDYELLEVLNSRPGWSVYKARRIASGPPSISRGQVVSLQRLTVPAGQIDTAQFQRQAESLRKMKHAHIPCYLDAFVAHGRNSADESCCLVIESFDGQSLPSLLERNRSGLPWPQSKELFSQVLEALCYASQFGAVHGNLALSSLFVTSNGAAKLMDFGLALKPVGRGAPPGGGAIVPGCLDYRAPDFARLPDSFLGDEQSDIFSLAACLFHALTGSLPFPPLGQNAAGDYFARWSGPQTPELEFRHPTFRILRHIRTWLSKALALDREKRFKTFLEALEDFGRIGYKRLRKGDEVYEFRERLGTDRIGEMFRAQRLSDGRRLAIKHLFEDLYSPQFAREARVLRGAKHPNLVEYVDFIEVRLRQDEQEHYLVLEYLEEMPEASLRNFINNAESDLDPLVVLRSFLGYLSCLEHLHQRGILHRDIKPANLYVSLQNPENGKLVDLGIIHEEDVSRTSGQIVGSLDYLPPEFASQGSGCGSAQSDLYSLGVALYQALTRKLPFPRLPEKESEAWLAFVRRAQNPPESSFDHPVFKAHPALIPLLRQAMMPDPKQRHSSAKAMRDGLQTIVDTWSSSQNRSAHDPGAAKRTIASVEVDHVPAEKHISPRPEPFPLPIISSQMPSQADETAYRRQLYESALLAARIALRQENWAEAEKQAYRALELSPGDSNAAQLVTEITQGRLKKDSQSKPGWDPRIKTVSPSRFQQAQPLRKSEEVVVATWGSAKLIKYPDGKLELKGGSPEDQAAAREWISLYLQNAVVKGLL